MGGETVPLHGLAPDDALALAEQELGRPLKGDERKAAEAICSALSGHPLRIRQAVAMAREDPRSLTHIAGTVRTREPAQALAEAVFEHLSPHEEQLLRLLAQSATDGGKRTPRLRSAIIPTPQPSSPSLSGGTSSSRTAARYSIGGDLAAAGGTLPLVEERERALHYYLDLAETIALTLRASWKSGPPFCTSSAGPLAASRARRSGLGRRSAPRLRGVVAGVPGRK